MIEGILRFVLSGLVGTCSAVAAAAVSAARPARRDVGHSARRRWRRRHNRPEGFRMFYRLPDMTVLRGSRAIRELSEVRPAEVARLVDGFFGRTDIQEAGVVA